MRAVFQHAENDPGGTPPLACAATLRLHPGLRRAAALGLLLIFILLAYTRLSWVRRQAPDFEFFFRAGAELVAHGSFDDGVDRWPDGTQEQRGTIEWYTPFVARLMTLPAKTAELLFGRLDGPMQPANDALLAPRSAFRFADCLWLAVNLAALAFVLRTIGARLLDLPAQDWPAWSILPLLTLGLFVYWEFRLNQVNLVTLLLLLGSFVCWQRGRAFAAGWWLGLAILLKLTPALLLAWFLLKRQFRTVAAALLIVLLCGPLADVLAFGPRYAAETYGAWLRAVQASSQGALIMAQREMDWRNQSPGAVLARTLSETSASTHFENDPRAARFNEPPQLRNVASLELGLVRYLALATSAVPLLLLCWLARRPAAACSSLRLRLEFAAFLLLMLWCMPVLRLYHLVWMLPAVALLLSQVYRADGSLAWRRLALLACAVVAAAQLAPLAVYVWNFRALEVYGVFAACVLVLAATLMLRLATLDARGPVRGPLLERRGWSPPAAEGMAVSHG